MIRNVEAAYAAGILDGEGSIAIRLLTLVLHILSGLEAYESVQGLPLSGSPLRVSYNLNVDSLP
jgi:hypothetical protein